ncbi:hypothetical protein [Novosphingobium lentum]|nr:hypothetical protein [Novosphingobium lentum]
MALKVFPFDPARHLETEEDILFFLEETLETLTSVLGALGLELTVQKKVA